MFKIESKVLSNQDRILIKNHSKLLKINEDRNKKNKSSNNNKFNEIDSSNDNQNK